MTLKIVGARSPKKWVPPAPPTATQVAPPPNRRQRCAIAAQPGRQAKNTSPTVFNAAEQAGPAKNGHPLNEGQEGMDIPSKQSQSSHHAITGGGEAKDGDGWSNPFIYRTKTESHQAVNLGVG